MIGKAILSTMVTLGLFIASNVLAADDYPTRPITMIVPFSEGGGFDTTARLLAPFIEEHLGAPVAVQNRAGAGGEVGHTLIAQADPDGYTIGMVGAPHFNMNVLVQDAPLAVDDYAFLGIVVADPVNIVVPAEAPYDDILQLRDAAQEDPGGIAVGATAGAAELAAWYLVNELDIPLTIVPYDSGGPGRLAFLGGHVDGYVGLVFADYAAVSDYAKSLGFFWDQEYPDLWPGTRPLPEQFEAEGVTVPLVASYRALAVPAALRDEHPDRYETLVNALEAAFNDPEFVAVADQAGLGPVLAWVGPDDAAELFGVMHSFVERNLVHLEQ